MDVTQTLETLAERLQTTGVRTVFGEPISAEGRTIIPVARVTYGFGGGGGLAGKRPDQSRDLTPELACVGDRGDAIPQKNRPYSDHRRTLGASTQASSRLKGEGAGGGGVRAVPAGVVEITRDQTRFVRCSDWKPLAAAVAIGFGLGVVLSKWAGRAARRG